MARTTTTTVTSANSCYTPTAAAAGVAAGAAAGVHGDSYHDAVYDGCHSGVGGVHSSVPECEHSDDQYSDHDDGYSDAADSADSEHNNSTTVTRLHAVPGRNILSTSSTANHSSSAGGTTPASVKQQQQQQRQQQQCQQQQQQFKSGSRSSRAGLQSVPAKVAKLARSMLHDETTPLTLRLRQVSHAYITCKLNMHIRVSV
jgi:hypothetical protein